MVYLKLSFKPREDPDSYDTQDNNEYAHCENNPKIDVFDILFFFPFPPTDFDF